MKKTRSVAIYAAAVCPMLAGSALAYAEAGEFKEQERRDRI